MSNTVQKKKKHQFPTAYTVIIIVLLLVQILTFFIPSGNYATLEYDQPNKEFVITKPNGSKHKEAATQKTLDKYKVCLLYTSPSPRDCS